MALPGIRYLGRTVTGQRVYGVPATIARICPLPHSPNPELDRRLRAFRQQIAVRTHRFGLALVPLGPG